MFDVWLGEVNLWNVLIILTVPAVLGLQLLLCFRVRSKILRWLPALLFGTVALACLLMLLRVTGWDALFYVVLAAYAGVLLLASLAGWAAWLIARLIRRRS